MDVMTCIFTIHRTIWWLLKNKLKMSMNTELLLDYYEMGSLEKYLESIRVTPLELVHIISYIEHGLDYLHT